MIKLNFYQIGEIVDIGDNDDDDEEEEEDI